ncbi:MAG: gliding motility-associated ABC transporter substrate-binding protein GldG [Prevotellaceae bacterium]|jgi:ABC-2 type transport system permease protein|nr:gliding motility-associated ABC transporter substrate-binding protein GldG [Prevotellaceae bacterium]
MNTKQKNILNILLIIVVIFLVNIILSTSFFRIDLTSDKRYTINETSKATMKQLDDFVYIKVYLDGEMPVEFKKLRRSINETITELQIYAQQKLQYEFINPMSGNEKEREAFFAELIKKGIEPFTIQIEDAEGGATQRNIFPAAVITYNGKEKSVNFFRYNDELSPDENINLAYQNIEFELISTIKLLSRKEFPKIAFIEGHGELDYFETKDLENELSQFYEINHVKLDGNVGVLDEYKAAIVAKPSNEWNEDDKLVIDQYIMTGGNVAWFIDEVEVHEDSLANGERTFAVQNKHNLDDLLFRYGARINADLVQDLQCAYVPVNIAAVGSQPNFQLEPWLYHPLLFPNYDNIITKGVNLVKSQYASTLDFVGSAKSNIKKTPLLQTSDKVKLTKMPAIISLTQINDKITEIEFNQSFKIIAAVFEGNFESGFKNRMLSKYNNGKPFDFVGEGKNAKMFIASDGDIIRNDVIRRANGTRPLPLGYDRYLNRTFGNKDFVKNIILYLTDDSGLLEIRSHEISLRLLDKEMVILNRNRIILINTLIPPVIILIFGISFTIIRKRKNTRKKQTTKQ